MDEIDTSFTYLDKLWYISGYEPAPHELLEYHAESREFPTVAEVLHMHADIIAQSQESSEKSNTLPVMVEHYPLAEAQVLDLDRYHLLNAILYIHDKDDSVGEREHLLVAAQETSAYECSVHHHHDLYDRRQPIYTWLLRHRVRDTLLSLATHLDVVVGPVHVHDGVDQNSVDCLPWPFGHPTVLVLALASRVSSMPPSTSILEQTANAARLAQSAAGLFNQLVEEGNRARRRQPHLRCIADVAFHASVTAATAYESTMYAAAQRLRWPGALAADFADLSTHHIAFRCAFEDIRKLSKAVAAQNPRPHPRRNEMIPQPHLAEDL